MSLFRLETTGNIPVITNDTVLYSAAGIHINDKHIILQTVITTFVFLFIIIWFTLIFNLSTKGYDDTTYNLLQFAVYFSIFVFFTVYLLLLIKSHLC